MCYNSIVLRSLWLAVLPPSASTPHALTPSILATPSSRKQVRACREKRTRALLSVLTGNFTMSRPFRILLSMHNDAQQPFLLPIRQAVSEHFRNSMIELRCQRHPEIDTQFLPAKNCEDTGPTACPTQSPTSCLPAPDALC